MATFDKSAIKITQYEVLGKLPDPFLRADGTRANTPEEFEAHKTELYRSAVELQYGTQPPAPEFLEVEELGSGRKSVTYRVTTGRVAHPVSFTMRIFLPKITEKCPVIVNGDLSFDYISDADHLSTVTDAGIAYAFFDRTELVPDRDVSRHAPLYDCYPEYTFGALGAWAWGYSRCVDALEKLGSFDTDWIAFTGHSRGGKTAALAGVLDSRARVVNPNETCAGSCSCYRIHMTGVTEDGTKTQRSETLADLCRRFNFWMGPDLQEYSEREAELPFDEHFIKALIAPRILVVGEATSDMWSNPVGSWMTSVAAEEVYALYGKQENLYWYFRRGYHYHKAEDLAMLVSVIKHHRESAPLCDGFFSTPFERPELIFDWRCPENQNN